MNKPLKDTYVPQAGDLCVRRIRDDRYEVSEWVGDIKGEWRDRKAVSLDELNRSIRTQKFLGKHNDWEYYRPGV